MSRRIAIFGASFNPPGLHHRVIAETLAQHFDEVIIVPCGPRADRQNTSDVEPIYRATLSDLAFRGIPKVRVELFDLELGTFSRTDKLEARFACEGEIWHVVGTDLTAGGSGGTSFIHSNWEGGAEMWETLNFAVVTPPDFPLSELDLPPRRVIIPINFSSAVSSSAIRENIFRRQPYQHLVPANVVDYIERYGLYRGRIASSATRYSIKEPRALIVADERNPQAREWARQLDHYRNEDAPNCIIVIGGDGTMLHAIRQHWRMRLPFLGVNAGHLGFLLNSAHSILGTELSAMDATIRQLPLLYIELEKADGTIETTLAFNDAWVERTTSQSAWVEVTVNNRVRIEKLVCDGVLVASAAGSTAYARSMGAFPLLADTAGWLVVGSNVMDPPGWKSALLSTEAAVELRSIGGEKRPIRAFVDGRAHGEVVAMKSRQSRTATAELTFHSANDMAEKIAHIQFPAPSKA